MAKVAIVTDSTAYIPAELLKQYNISTVPLAVIWGTETYEDGVTIQPSEFYQKLKTAKVMPTTSQASILNMRNTFQRLLAEEYEVFGIFISSKLSGTVQSAMQGRDELTSGKDKVHIFDSETTAMAMGFQALAAARAAAQGASIADCFAIAEKARANTGVYFMVDTLEYLHRGGRINSASKFLGTLLNMKPILTVQNGKVEAVERVRTKVKALDRVIEIVAEKTQGSNPVHIATLNANAEEDAKALLEKTAKVVNATETIFSGVSPVIGTHTGPGTLGIAYLAGM